MALTVDERLKQELQDFAVSLGNKQMNNEANKVQIKEHKLFVENAKMWGKR